jgi:hypothetical protein
VIAAAVLAVFLLLFFLWLWTMAFTHGSGGLDLSTTTRHP